MISWVPASFSGRTAPRDVSPFNLPLSMYIRICLALKSTDWHVAQRQPLLMFAVSRGPCLLVQYSTADFRFLLTLFKRGPRNIFLRPQDTCHIKQAIFYFFAPKFFFKLSELKGSDLWQLSDKIMFLVWFAHYVIINLHQEVDAQWLKWRGAPRLKNTKFRTEYKYFMMPWLSWTSQLNPSVLQWITKTLVHLLMSIVYFILET